MGTVTTALHWDTRDAVPSRLSVRVGGEGSEGTLAASRLGGEVTGTCGTFTVCPGTLRPSGAAVCPALASRATSAQGAPGTEEKVMSLNKATPLSLSALPRCCQGPQSSEV